MAERKNLPFISHSYTIGAFLVLIGHSIVNGSKGFTLHIDNIRTFIYFIHMPMFFYVAGLLLSYTKGLKREPYLAFIKKKAWRFLVPYFVLTLIGYIPKVILPINMFGAAKLTLTYFLRTIFFPRENIWGHFWFLPALLILYVFSYLLLKAAKKPIFAVIVTAVLLGLAIYPLKSHFLTINDLCKCSIYFWIGILSSDYIIKNEDKILNPIGGIITFLLSVAIYIPFINEYWRHYYKFLWARLYCTVNVIVAILCLYSILCLGKFFERHVSKLMNYFIGKTFVIYMLSWPVQAVVQYITFGILDLNWMVIFVIMMAVGLTFPLTVIKIYKYFTRICKYEKLNYFIKTVIGA